MPWHVWQLKNFTCMASASSVFATLRRDRLRKTKPGRRAWHAWKPKKFTCMDSAFSASLRETNPDDLTWRHSVMA